MSTISLATNDPIGIILPRELNIAKTMFSLRQITPSTTDEGSRWLQGYDGYLFIFPRLRLTI